MFVSLYVYVCVCTHTLSVTFIFKFALNTYKQIYICIYHLPTSIKYLITKLRCAKAKCKFVKFYPTTGNYIFCNGRKSFTLTWTELLTYLRLRNIIFVENRVIPKNSLIRSIKSYHYCRNHINYPQSQG